MSEGNVGFKPKLWNGSCVREMICSNLKKEEDQYINRYLYSACDSSVHAIETLSRDVSMKFNHEPHPKTRRIIELGD